jgi:hypothetical protein
MTLRFGSGAAVLGTSIVGLAPSGDMMVLAVVTYRYALAVYACLSGK